MRLDKAIMEVKAIQMARLCSAQENPDSPVVCIDKKANEALDKLIDIAEKFRRRT